MITPLGSDTLDIAQLCQLMHFYAESGVEWLLEDEAVDRKAELQALEAARQRQPAAEAAARPQPTGARSAREQAPEPRPQPARATAMPDAEAVSEAQRVANAAASVEDLLAAVAAFTGCNLRNSARNAAFFSGATSARILIAGGAPGTDDDRNGAPFSGAHGDMLGRMMSALGLEPDRVAMFNLIPWRPPGNRSPTPHELEICRPFGFRLIELMQPQALLAMGNLSARFLSGSSESIHSLRGRWMEVAVNGFAAPMLPTFHPQDLVAAPACKRLAWQDLLSFKSFIERQ